MHNILNKIYAVQENSTSDRFLYAQRYLNRLFRYEDKYHKLISDIDVNRLGLEIKTILYCMLYLRGLDILKKYQNLNSLLDTEPLEEKLVLQENEALRVGYIYPIYEKFNIII